MQLSPDDYRALMERCTSFLVDEEHGYEWDLTPIEAHVLNPAFLEVFQEVAKGGVTFKPLESPDGFYLGIDSIDLPDFGYIGFSLAVQELIAEKAVLMGQFDRVEDLVGPATLDMWIGVDSQGLPTADFWSVSKAAHLWRRWLARQHHMADEGRVIQV